MDRLTHKYNLPAFSTLIMDENLIFGPDHMRDPMSFMGLDIRILQENFAKMKQIRIKISENERPKPYANMEIRLWNPPTVALKSQVDLSYPIRMLTQDRQFVKSFKGKILVINCK